MADQPLKIVKDTVTAELNDAQGKQATQSAEFEAAAKNLGHPPVTLLTANQRQEIQQFLSAESPTAKETVTQEETAAPVPE